MYFFLTEKDHSHQPKEMFKSTIPHCIHVHLEKGVVLHYNKPKSLCLAMFG